MTSNKITAITAVVGVALFGCILFVADQMSESHTHATPYAILVDATGNQHQMYRIEKTTGKYFKIHHKPTVHIA